VAFDIANHFHEWTADYHSSTPHIMNPSLYPTIEQRYNFYSAYLEHTLLTTTVFPDDITHKAELDKLEKQVQAWSPASHAMWAIWGIVQSREDIEAQVAEVEFDYAGYAKYRMGCFRKELSELNI
jgi:choline kinase